MDYCEGYVDYYGTCFSSFLANKLEIIDDVEFLLLIFKSLNN